MIGRFTGLFHFTGTPGYMIARIDGNHYKLFDFNIYEYCHKELGAGWNYELPEPVKVDFEVNDNNEIITLVKYEE